MARNIEIIVPPDRTEQLVADIESLDGVINVRVEIGGPRRPRGDVISALTTNVTLHPLLRLLEQHGVPGDPGASVTLSEPAGIISSTAASAISGDTTEIP